MKDNIIKLNKDIEQYVIQSSVTRSRHTFERLYSDKFKPLSFVHAADIHAELEMWNRMVEYINHYKEYLAFALHTGDYCGGSQKIYVDFYKEGSPCERPIYNCTGNHDCFPGEGEWELAEKEITYNLLFNHTDDWNVNFMDCPYSMSYYKDFPESNVRMIVLDDYYHIEETRIWLKSVLDDAIEQKLHVITAQHEPTDYITEHYNVKYHTLDEYDRSFRVYEAKRTRPAFDQRGRLLYEDVIVDFIARGGVHVCNLAGHNHVDEFGYTARGVLNVVVANGTTWDVLGDMKRVKGTKSWDCFNVIAVDADLGLLKIVRVGANVDHYLRKKTALCFDYINKKVISDI